MRAFMASVLGKCQIAAFASMFFLDHLLPDGLRENKLMSFFGIWLGGSMVSSSITSSHAFEIYLGKRLVWSSLRNHRHPDVRDLFHGFQKVGVTLRT